MPAPAAVQATATPPVSTPAPAVAKAVVEMTIVFTDAQSEAQRLDLLLAKALVRTAHTQSILAVACASSAFSEQTACADRRWSTLG